MRKLFRLFLVLAATPMLFVACKPDTPSTDVQPEMERYLELTTPEVMDVPAEGGIYEVKWEEKEREVSRTTPYYGTIETNVDWISLQQSTTEYGHLFFSAAENEGELREGKIVITFHEQVINVIIKQAGAGETPQPEASFNIDVQEVHAASAITQVTPADSDMYYVMFLDEVSYLQFNGIATAEQLWQDDYTAFESGAIANNMNLKAYMEAANVLFKGTKRVQWNSVRPGTKSVLYVYGVKFSEDGASYEPVTDIEWVIIEPERAPLQDVEFGIDVEVKGADVTLDIKSSDWDGYYLVKIVDANNEFYPGEGVEFGDDFMAALSDEWINVYSSNLKAGHTMQDILDNVCYKGDTILDASLESYVLYSALVYPVAEYDGFVQVVGKPSYLNFSTEEVGQSDMDINIEVTNCYVRVCDIKITPSNPDEKWLLLITPTSYLPADYDDEILLDYALGEFIYYTYEFKGEVTTHMNTLYPDTEYIIVAFGYSGGVVTTDVCSKVFKTQKEGKCELEVTDVVVGGPYRVSDLYAYDPVTFEYYKPPYYYDSSHFVITMEVKTSEPTTDIFSDFIYKADYDYHGYELMFYDLLIDTCEPYYATTVEWEWNDTGIFANCYACAAAFDYKGDVTPMWMSELYQWTMDDIRPIEEFIEKWEAQSGNMQVLSIGRDNRSNIQVVKL